MADFLVLYVWLPLSKNPGHHVFLMMVELATSIQWGHSWGRGDACDAGHSGHSFMEPFISIEVSEVMGVPQIIQGKWMTMTCYWHNNGGLGIPHFQKPLSLSINNIYIYINVI